MRFFQPGFWSRAAVERRAGRLESALTSFELLTTRDPHAAGRLAQQLDSYNAERQDMTTEIREKAARVVLEEDPNTMLFFASDPDFSEGSSWIGSLASGGSLLSPVHSGAPGRRIYRFASCRSIPEFHITQALDECADLLVRHGGHAAAAGFTVRNEDKDALVARLREIATRLLGEQELLPELDIDREIKLDKLGAQYIPGILEGPAQAGTHRSRQPRTGLCLV